MFLGRPLSSVSGIIPKKVGAEVDDPRPTVREAMRSLLAWAKLIAGAQVRTFKNAGHLVLDEKPESVKVVADFLA